MNHYWYQDSSRILNTCIQTVLISMGKPAPIAMTRWQVDSIFSGIGVEKAILAQ
jgi:hypothetical protein